MSKDLTIKEDARLSDLLAIADSEHCKVRIKLVPKKGKIRKVKVVSVGDEVVAANAKSAGAKKNNSEEAEPRMHQPVR
jgi:hypothetical protein